MQKPEPACGRIPDCPLLLSALGLPIEDLIKAQIGHLEEAREFENPRRLLRALHSDAMARWTTLPHRVADVACVDRVRRDQEIQKMASDHGVTQVNEKTVRAEKLGRKMLVIHTLAVRGFLRPSLSTPSGKTSNPLNEPWCHSDRSLNPTQWRRSWFAFNTGTAIAG